MNADDLFSDANVVFRYTRAQAIADGVLVDVSELAKEAGFRIPVAVTCALWQGYITPPPPTEQEGQSTTGRLWDVLSVLRMAIRSGPANSEMLLFSVLFRMTDGTETVKLKALCGPGDDAEPVITIILPDED
jgi:hypothetical protein